MAERTENVGVFTAYGFAREGGYVGTKAEFEEGLAKSANYATNAQASATAAANSATAASGSATAAAGSASTAAGYAQDADEFAQAAAASADEAEEYAESIDPDQFAKIDGYYGTLKSGESDTADNLTPYSSDSGTSQNTPFIDQGSGCANGEEQADTGSYCQLQRKNGNTVTVNQLSDIEDGSRTDPGNAVSTHSFTFLRDHKYLVSAKVMFGTQPTTEGGSAFPSYPVLLGVFDSSITSYARHMFAYSASGFYIAIDSGNSWNGYLTSGTSAKVTLQMFPNTDDTVTYSKVIFIDLTLWFGSNDKIPTHLLNHPEDFFRYYQGDLSYNVGTLTDSNGRYLKTRERNIWDEEWENGRLSSAGNDLSGNGIRSKNYIKVVPNTNYYEKLGSYSGGTSMFICFYDSEKHFISSVEKYGSTTFATPSNCIFIRFSIFTSSAVTSYNHDITISLYYEGESGYDQYYPYEELADIDTGNEPLLAFDWKEPKTGTIHHDTLPKIDLGTLNWSYDSTYGFMFTLALKDIIIKNTQVRANEVLICSAYQSTDISAQVSDSTMLNAPDKSITYHCSNNVNAYLYIKDSAYTDAETFKAAMSGVYLEIKADDDHKTTEQGTPFPENVAIDDFGTMSFDCPNGVPQGNLIFYPVDYKAEQDTLHNITQGDMHKIALKGDNLAPTDPDTIKGVVDAYNALYAINQENMGGALRHMLADKAEIDFANTAWVDLGSLTWLNVTTNVFCANVTGFTATPNSLNCLSSKYKTVDSASTMNATDNSIGLNLSGYGSVYPRVYIHDTAISSVGDVASAVKGILLAYEKAST